VQFSTAKIEVCVDTTCKAKSATAKAISGHIAPGSILTYTLLHDVYRMYTLATVTRDVEVQ